ncbi:MAG: metallophosphoesterase, partial [Clostridia bacterium]|nr:metallophosphoesterase [Clostridia bacterium]
MTYVISDLHGYPLEKFKALLKKAGFGFWAEAGSADDLYVLGDVIDRNGDGGIDVLRWIMEQPNVHMILGNHECMLLACRFLFEEVTDESLDALTWEQLDSYEIWKLNGCAPTVESLRQLTR